MQWTSWENISTERKSSWKNPNILEGEKNSEKSLFVCVEYAKFAYRDRFLKMLMILR